MTGFGLPIRQSDETGHLKLIPEPIDNLPNLTDSTPIIALILISRRIDRRATAVGLGGRSQGDLMGLS